MPGLRPRQHAWCVQQLLALLPEHPHLLAGGEAAPLVQVLGALDNADLLPEDSMSDTLLRKAPTPQSLRQPLGPVGNAHVPIDLWFAAGLPRQLPPHPPQRRSSAAAQPFLLTLEAQGLLAPCAATAGSPAFALFKTSAKARQL